MKNLFASCLLPIMLSTCAVAPVMAQQIPCVQDYEKELVGALYEDYGEVLVGEGLSKAGMIIQLFASEETNTFTIVAIRPDGLTCFVEAGDAWNSVSVVILPEGELN